ncbi:Glutathione peroxidase [Aphelenchoides bicaudatus]|nr:Glutathione peroxidase [Aphelenchoides bicaudatus]
MNNCAEMIKICFFVLALVALHANASDENTIYQFKAQTSGGEEVSLDKYRGKVVIIVNGASECGLTQTNYVQLKELLDKYKSQGLEIAVFPSNEFGGQQFLGKKFNFEPDLYAKIETNGDNAHPLYKFLKEQQPGTLTDSIKWNFTKFLVNRKGRAIERYAPTTSPNSMIEDIEKALAESA